MFRIRSLAGCFDRVPYSVKFLAEILDSSTEVIFFTRLVLKSVMT